MELIKNHAGWITPELMNWLSTCTGDTVPVWQPNRWKGHPMLESALERARFGYSDNKHFFQQFNFHSKDSQNIKFESPLIEEKGDRKESWWFVKLLPGQLQPMHFDPILIELKNPVRYTMFLQDWQPGHIYTWNDQMIANYKAGDMYRWKDPMCYHGCVNIGYETRYTLQITLHD
jgi:hypothetical protein